MSPNMKVVAITNQKGGVGKTTTVIELGAALAELGHKVLLVDLSPQGNVGEALGLENSPRRIEQLLLSTAPLAGYVSNFGEALEGKLPSGLRGKRKRARQLEIAQRIDVLPSSFDLVKIPTDLALLPAYHLKLRSLLEADPRWDFVLIDTPPMEAAVFANLALFAADLALMPTLASDRDVSQTIKQAHYLAEYFPEVHVIGVMLQMVGKTQTITEEATDAFTSAGLPVLAAVGVKAEVRRAIRSEMPHFLIRPDDPISDAYRTTANQLSER